MFMITYEGQINVIFTTLYTCAIFYIDAVHCEVSVSELYNVCFLCILTYRIAGITLYLADWPKKPFA